MKIFLKSVYILTLCAVIITCVPAAYALNPVSADSDGMEYGADDFEYVVREGKAEITAYHGKGNAVAVPDFIDGYPVCGIGNEVFRSESGIKKLLLGNNLENIGRGSFSDCTGIETLVIPSSLNTVGDGAFSGCYSLSEVFFNTELCYVGDSAFENCTSLGFAVLPQSVDYIGVKAFAGCKNLTDIIICSPSVSVNSRTFGGTDSSLVNVYVPASSAALEGQHPFRVHKFDSEKAFSFRNVMGGIEITEYRSDATAAVIPSEINGKKVVSVGEKAFADRSLLSVVFLPDSINNIEKSAFENDTALRRIRMPVSMDGHISANAFRNCSSLVSVTIPENIESVSTNTFDGCSALEKVTFPKSLDRIMSGAFYRCPNLDTLVFGGSEPSCAYKDGTDFVVAFGNAPQSMKIYTDGGTEWKTVKNGIWYPNGENGYKGFEVTVRNYDCFYVEHIINRPSCTQEGKSEFVCPFCGRSYVKTSPVLPHEFVSMGITDGVETFRCIHCSANYTLRHIEYADIAAKTSILGSGTDIIEDVIVTFRGEKLRKGIDFTYKLISVPKYSRIEIVVTGMDKFTGSQVVAYSAISGERLNKYKLTVNGASGSGFYCLDDRIELVPDTPVPDGMDAVWEISGGKFIYASDSGAMIEMPSHEVTVTLSYAKSPETTVPPDTTEVPDDTTKTPDNTTKTPDDTTKTPDDTTKTPDDTTDIPSDTTTGTDEKEPSFEAKPYIVHAVIWGAVLVVSFAGLIWLCISVFKKQK